MAQHIATSHGPSGANTDYLLQLDEALKSLAIEDDHVAMLPAAVRELIKGVSINSHDKI